MRRTREICIPLSNDTLKHWKDAITDWETTKTIKQGKVIDMKTSVVPGAGPIGVVVVEEEV